METRTLATVQRATRDDWGYVHGFGWELSLLFEPRDLWVGVYWTPRTNGAAIFGIYVCLLPMLPIRLLLWGLR